MPDARPYHLNPVQSRTRPDRNETMFIANEMVAATAGFGPGDGRRGRSRYGAPLKIIGDYVPSTKSSINLKQKFHYRSWGLRQASAPAALASPGCDSAVLPVPVCAPDTGNTEASQCFLSPSGDWRRKRGQHYLSSSGAQILKKIQNGHNTNHGLVVDFTQSPYIIFEDFQVRVRTLYSCLFPQKSRV